MNFQAGNRKIEIQTELASTVKCTFMLDIQRVQQIMINLLSNATKFSKIKGSISIIAAVDVTAPGKATIYITVKDKGIGIP